jgi:DNA polymerase epsilon subunit 2
VVLLSLSLSSILAAVTNSLLHHLEGFDSLADLIASYTLITRHTHFIFVPGPQDLTINSVLPRKPLLSSFTARLRAKIPKVHLASNPCRLKFFGQEIVIFREDVMLRMLRNLVGVKPDVRNDDLKRYVRVCDFSSSPITTITITPFTVTGAFPHNLFFFFFFS